MQSKNVADVIVKWLKERNEEAGTKGFIVGVSGGIDSAVTSTLCAMTGLDTIVMNMPILDKDIWAGDADADEAHIIWLEDRFDNIQWQYVGLSDTFEALKKTMYFIRSDLAWANVAARLRMVALYNMANEYNMLVVGTGNKVEDMGIGFFTKYGDGGVDISPVGDLLKSEVYELGKHFGILERILKAKPTDGLWEDSRTDEDQIGATYDELEFAMNFQNEGVDVSELEGRQKEVWDIYHERHLKNSHKMLPIPICYIHSCYMIDECPKCGSDISKDQCLNPECKHNLTWAGALE